LLEIALVAAVFDDETPVLERAAYAKKQLVFFEGLKDVVIGAATNGFKGR